MSGQSGCNAGLLEAPRVIDHDQLQADYDLEVALNKIDKELWAERL